MSVAFTGGKISDAVRPHRVDMWYTIICIIVVGTRGHACEVCVGRTMCESGGHGGGSKYPRQGFTLGESEACGGGDNSIQGVVTLCIRYV